MIFRMGYVGVTDQLRKLINYLSRKCNNLHYYSCLISLEKNPNDQLKRYNFVLRERCAGGTMKVKRILNIFLILKKRHFKQGTISQLKLSDGVFVISVKDILSECESFYKYLQASKIDNSVNFDFFQQANETFQTPDDQRVCNGLLTNTECEEALKSMNADKTPTTDRARWSSSRILQSLLG